MNVTELVEDIKLLLGGGVVRLEVGDEDIEKLIKFAFKKIKPYISDRKLITVPSARCIDMTDKKVLEVIRVYPTSIVVADSSQGVSDKELLFDFQVYRTGSNIKTSKADIVRRYSVDDFEIPFEFEDGKLYISVGSVYSGVTVEAIVDVSLEELKDERAVAWVQGYALALTKERVGRIRSKFKASGLPVELDGDTLIQEARDEKGKLEDELENKDFGPSFVLR